MPYKGKWAQIPCGQGGITAEQNPTRILPQELIPESPVVSSDTLVTQGIMQVDGVWRREPGATSVDPLGLPGTAPVYGATLGSAKVWATALATYLLSTGSTTATAIANNTNTASGNTLTITIGATTAASGTLCVVAVSYLANPDYPNVDVTDSKGNTWVSIGQDTLGTNPAFLFVSTLTSSLVNGDTITVAAEGNNQGTSPSNPTWSGIAATVVTFTNATTLDETALAWGLSTTPSVSSGPLSALPALSLCAVGSAGGTGTSLTQTTSFTSASRVGAGTDVAVALCYRVYTGTTPLQIHALHHWRPTETSTDWAIVSAGTDGVLYKSNSAGTDLDATTLATGLSTSAKPGRFVDGGGEQSGNDRKLFFFNGSDPVKVVTGTGVTASTIAAGATDWSGTNQPVNGIVHRGALVAFGNKNAPHRAYWSASGDHDDFTSDGYSLLVYPSVGERIWGCAGWNGLLWLFKSPNGIFWVDDADTDSAQWTAQMLSGVVGCAPSPYAVLPLGNDVMILTADGRFMLLSALKESGGVAHTQALSTKLRIDRWLRETLNLSALNRAVSVWYPHKRQAVWGLPTGTSTSCDLRLTFDFEPTERGGLPVVTPSYRDTCDALALYRETDQVERPMLGQGAQVFLLDRDERSKDGAGYEATLVTPHLDLRYVDPVNALVQKQFDWLIIRQNVQPSGETDTYQIHVFIDGTYRTTLSGTTAARRQRHKLGMRGYEISLAVTSSGSADDHALVEFLLGYSLTDEGAI